MNKEVVIEEAFKESQLKDVDVSEGGKGKGIG